MNTFLLENLFYSSACRFHCHEKWKTLFVIIYYREDLLHGMPKWFLILLILVCDKANEEIRKVTYAFDYFFRFPFIPSLWPDILIILDYIFLHLVARCRHQWKSKKPSLRKRNKRIKKKDFSMSGLMLKSQAYTQ